MSRKVLWNLFGDRRCQRARKATEWGTFLGSECDILGVCLHLEFSEAFSGRLWQVARQKQVRLAVRPVQAGRRAKSAKIRELSNIARSSGKVGYKHHLIGSSQAIREPLPALRRRLETQGASRYGSQSPQRAEMWEQRFLEHALNESGGEWSKEKKGERRSESGGGRNRGWRTRGRESSKILYSIGVKPLEAPF